MRTAKRLSLLLLALLVPTAANATTTVMFASGSLIIPMDTDFQDVGMLKAFGLLDKLLRAGIPVSWCITPNKAAVDTTNGVFTADFTAAAKDLQSGTVITDKVNNVPTGTHAYRGGPFVIDVSNAAAATPIIKAWQASNTTAVHVAQAAFVAPVSKTLTAAPRIAVLGDGNQNIAFGYLNAAGILDENNLAWPNNSVDLLTPQQVAGPSWNPNNPTANVNVIDGALFTASGQPAFCEIMTMHWNVTDTDVPAVTAEMKQFLQYPVHLNAECQAVNAVEGAPPAGGNQKFVAPHGFVWPAPQQPNAVQFSNSALPFAQMDGPFQTVGGSEPAYALPMGDAYYDSGIVMVRAAGQPEGVQDLWMTGYAGGGCPIGFECNGVGVAKGKVSYLGGHQYQTMTPMSKSPQTQGTRLFLNSLFEAGCVDGEGQPVITVSKAGPAYTATASVTYTLTFKNTGNGPALGFSLADTLPKGTTFVSASNKGMFANGVVTWSEGDVASGGGGSETVTITLPAYGMYANQAVSSFKVGNNTWQVSSNSVQTTYGPQQDMAVPPDLTMEPDLATPPDMAVPPDLQPPCNGGCPAPQNPCLKAVCMQNSCVNVANDGVACTLDACTTQATCLAGACQGGVPITCAAATSVCQVAACDPHNGCGFVPANEGGPCATANQCVRGMKCTAGACGGGMQVVCARAACTSAACDPNQGCQMAPVPQGMDPFNDCAGLGCATACNGMGACVPCPPSDMAMAPQDLAAPPMGDGGGMPVDGSPMTTPDMAEEPDLAMMTTPMNDLSMATDMPPYPSDIAFVDTDGGRGADGGGGDAATPAGDAATPAGDAATAANADLALSGGVDLGGGTDGPKGNGAGGCGCAVGARPDDSRRAGVAAALLLALAFGVRSRRRKAPEA